MSAGIITGILLDTRTRIEGGKTTFWAALGRFHARRVLRLFPVYYLVLGLCWAAGVPALREKYPDASDEERLLRYSFAGTQVDDMLAAGPMRTVYHFDKPIVRLLKELAKRPRAGRTVPLKVLLRGYRGDEVVRTIPVGIPANASGTVSLSVIDGARLSLGL